LPIFYKQIYAIMKHNQRPSGQKPGKVVYATVAFRYSDEVSVMLVGEAEIVIETFGSDCNQDDLSTNLYAVRVDILSAYDPEGGDQYHYVMADQTLRLAVESAALDHYLLPPQIVVGLPKWVVEW
jgi:hypothetical protein